MAMLNNQMVYQKGNPIDEAAYWNDRGFWTLCIEKGGWSGHGWFIVKFIASMIICDYISVIIYLWLYICGYTSVIICDYLWWSVII